MPKPVIHRPLRNTKHRATTPAATGIRARYTDTA
jgi:hypothetical protein